MNLNVSTWIGSIILDNGEVTAGLKINFIQASDGDQRKNMVTTSTFWDTSLWLQGSMAVSSEKKLVLNDGV